MTIRATSMGRSNTLQEAYDADASVPQISVTNGLPLTVDLASGTGDIFTVRDAANLELFKVNTAFLETANPIRPEAAFGDIEFETSDGIVSYRIDGKGLAGSRPQIEWIPDGYTQVAATGGPGSMMSWTSTYVSNIPGGGGLGNDGFGGFINAQGTFDLQDPGNLFSTGLLFNMGMQVNLQARSGPIYTLIDQPRMIADGIATTISQHNAVRAQPAYGPHVNGGSLVAASAQIYFATITVDATGGASAITDVDYFVANSPNLVSGGTIGTFDVLDIRDITGPTTIRGINSLMSNGTFIAHTGTAPAEFGGAIRLSAGAGAADWEITRLAANIATLGTADSLRISTGSLRFGSSGSVGLSSSVADRLDLESGDSLLISIAGSLQFGGTVAQINTPVADNIRIRAERLSIGATSPTGIEEWFLAFTPPAQTTEAIATDHARILFSPGAAITVDHAITNLSGFLINEPFISIGSGSVVNAANVIIQTAPGAGTNRYGLLITSNPSGGTLNYALRCTLGDARFDGRLDINNGIALGGGAAPTLGTIGGSGPTAAAQAQWVEIDVGGTAHWIPVWT